MKTEKDYRSDIAAIRHMMERSSKFLSLSGWAGVMAGLYALGGAWLAYDQFNFNPAEPAYPAILMPMQLIVLAVVILILALGTAVVLSHRKAVKRNERIWNTASRRMLLQMAFPLVAGGLFALILISKDLVGLLTPVTLLFYGLSLVCAGSFTYKEIRFLGIMEILLGLAGACYTAYGLLFWAIGFGLLHILTGVYLHYKYEQ